MRQININSYKNIEKTIEKLRLKLNKIYETDGHTEEVVKLSQELDKYIIFAQKEILKTSNKQNIKHI